MFYYTAGMIFFGIKLEHTNMSFQNLRWVIILYFEFVTGIILLGFALNFVVSNRFLNLNPNKLNYEN